MSDSTPLWYVVNNRENEPNKKRYYNTSSPVFKRPAAADLPPAQTAAYLPELTYTRMCT